MNRAGHSLKVAGQLSGEAPASAGSIRVTGQIDYGP